MDKENLRRLLEMAYLYAWDRTPVEREEFRKFYQPLVPTTGMFAYCGDGKFQWVDYSL